MELLERRTLAAEWAANGQVLPLPWVAHVVDDLLDVLDATRRAVRDGPVQWRQSWPLRRRLVLRT
jgi:hypothetical protein